MRGSDRTPFCVASGLRYDDSEGTLSSDDAGPMLFEVEGSAQSHGPSARSEDSMAKGKSTQKKETKKPKKDKSAEVTKDGKKK